MEIKYKEVKLTPLQEVATTYEFLCGDLHEGLIYGVSDEIKAKCEKVIGDELGEKVELNAANSRTFVEDLYPILGRALKKREGGSE